MKKLVIILSILPFASMQMYSETLEQQARAKITQLEALMNTAEREGFDVKREELAVWVAEEFLKFANWDENNTSKNTTLFNGYGPYRKNSAAMANALPDDERRHVIQVLETAIAELQAVVDGTVERRAAVVPDWNNAKRGDDEMVSNGKPVFLYDYFSKSFGVDNDDPSVYNDYLGNINKTTSISCHFSDASYKPVMWRINEIKNATDDRVGYSLYWNKPLANHQLNISEVSKGKSYYFDFDIDNPSMRRHMKVVAENVAYYMKNKKVIELGYCLANEPHWYSEAGFWTQNSGEMTEISSYTLNKFRDWLEVKYGTLDAFKQSWRINVTSFDEIPWVVPVPTSYHGKPQWYDWCRFNMDRVNDYFQMLNDAISSKDPNAMTHLKIMSSTFMEDRHAGIDLETLTEMSGLIGDDAAAQKRNNAQTTASPWEANFAYEWKEIAMMYDFMESVSPDKIHINTESHFVSTSKYRDMNMQPKYVRNVYWLATLHGMDVNLTWFWPRKPDGSPEDRFFDGSYGESSYPGSCAMQPLVVNEYAKVMMDMNAYSEEILKLRRLKKPVRVFYTEVSNIYNNDQIKTDSYALYEKLYFDGNPVGFATEKIIKKQDNDLWDVIAIYKTKNATAAEMAALQSYLDNGGTIVMDGASLIFNEYNKRHTDPLNTNNGGTLVNLGVSATAAQVAEKAKEYIRENTLVEVEESNGLVQKGTLWRTTEAEDGGYLLNLLNLGKNEAEITISLRAGFDIISVKDMMTGKEIGTSFKIPSEGVLLLKVTPDPTSEPENEMDGIEFLTEDGSLTIMGAQGEMVNIYDLSGRLLKTRKVENDMESINLPFGVALVNVINVGTQKVIIK